MARGICFLCGNYEDIEVHHIFMGALRSKADRYGLTVPLCHWCHQEDRDSAHKSLATKTYLHKYGQMKAMREQGWSKEEFIREFGKNYLDDAELELLNPAPVRASSFAIIEEENYLPW